MASKMPWLGLACNYLLQGLFPAVALFAEGTSKLLGMNASLVRAAAHAGRASAAACAMACVLTSVQILGAHLLLEMLFQTGLVCKFAKAIGAFERPIVATVGSLHVIVEEPFLREVFATGHADKRPFAGMNAIVNVEVGLAGVGLGANGADEGFLAGVHADVLLQAVVVVARLFAQRAHEVRGLGVCRQVGS